MARESEQRVVDDDVIMDIDIEFLFSLVGDELGMLPYCEKGVVVRHPFLFYTDNLFKSSGFLISRGG